MSPNHARDIAIHQRYEAGGITQRELAAEYNISASGVRRVINQVYFRRRCAIIHQHCAERNHDWSRLYFENAHREDAANEKEQLLRLATQEQLKAARESLKARQLMGIE